MKSTVTTELDEALSVAAVTRDCRPVIALLHACLYEAITTPREFTGVETVITVVSVRVITLLIWTDLTIAADRLDLAKLRTPITVDARSIITLLRGLINEPIATLSELTSKCTRVVVADVSIITLLTLLENAISTVL